MEWIASGVRQLGVGMRLFDREGAPSVEELAMKMRADTLVVGREVPR